MHALVHRSKNSAVRALQERTHTKSFSPPGRFDAAQETQPADWMRAAQGRRLRKARRETMCDLVHIEKL